jgi:hypothetical protein
MATPSTREGLKQYALRALGKPVIEINVDDDQLEDRIDEALQYYAQYHYDAIRRTYLKYQYTQEDKDRITSNSTESVTKIVLLLLGKKAMVLSLCLKVYFLLLIYFLFQIKVI